MVSGTGEKVVALNFLIPGDKATSVRRGEWRGRQAPTLLTGVWKSFENMKY